MGRSSSYGTTKCKHPRCIKGGVPANILNEECWLNSKNDEIPFCSIECKEDYLKNEKYFKKLDDLFNKVYVNRSRKRKKLAEAIQTLNPDMPIKEINKMINLLGLSSKYV